MVYLDVKKSRKSYKLYEDQAYIGFLYRSDFEKLGIKPPSFSEENKGEKLSLGVTPEAYEKIKEIIIYRAYDKGVTYLTDSERSAYDIRLRLMQKDFPEYAIDEAINILYEYKYLDDRRFAQSYIRTYMKSKSRSMLIKELSMRRIELPDINEIMDEVYEDESMDENAAIEDLMRRKYSGQDLSDEKVRRRAVNFLLRHGFSFDQINNYLT